MKKLVVIFMLSLVTVFSVTMSAAGPSPAYTADDVNIGSGVAYDPMTGMNVFIDNGTDVPYYIVNDGVVNSEASAAGITYTLTDNGGFVGDGTDSLGIYNLSYEFVVPSTWVSPPGGGTVTSMILPISRTITVVEMTEPGGGMPGVDTVDNGTDVVDGNTDINVAGTDNTSTSVPSKETQSLAYTALT